MRRWRRKIVLVLAILASVLVVPIAFSPTVAGAAGPCDLSPDLAPEIVGGGVDGLVKPPPPDSDIAGGAGVSGLSVDGSQTPDGGTRTTTTLGAAEPLTNYDRYGMAGQFWHTYELGCNDVAAVLGNAWANTVFSWAKAIDRMTITTYQAAATEGPLQSIKDVVDDIVTNLADAMYWPYLRVIILLAAVWLAWYGLIRKRASTTAEGVIWMILAVTVAVWFFSRPGDFTGLGKMVTDKTGEVVNSAFSGLPGAGGASCLPTKGQTNAKPGPGGYGQSGTPGVEQNADALWSTLVCKPWLMGEFGTADPNAPIVKAFGAKMLDLQATDVTEQTSGQKPSSGAHQTRFVEEVAKPLENTPTFFLLQGKDWTSRLGIAIGALMAAMVTGVLIFLVAVSLIALKIGFLLLLILGPVFLLLGVHPGVGAHHRHALGRDADRHPAAPGGAGARARRARVRLCVDHLHEPAVGHADHVHRPADDRRLLLPAPVPAPVLVHGRAHAHHPDAGRGRLGADPVACRERVAAGGRRAHGPLGSAQGRAAHQRGGHGGRRCRRGDGRRRRPGAGQGRGCHPRGRAADRHPRAGGRAARPAGRRRPGGRAAQGDRAWHRGPAPRCSPAAQPLWWPGGPRTHRRFGPGRRERHPSRRSRRWRGRVRRRKRLWWWRRVRRRELVRR